MANKKKKNTGLALAIWILALLVLLIVFLVKKDAIISNLKSTNFFEITVGKNPEFVEKHEDKPKESNGALTVDVKPAPGASEIEGTDTLSPEGDLSVQKKPEEDSSQSVAVESPATTAPSDKTDKTDKSDKKDTAPAVAPATNEKSKVNLCFVAVTGNGTVARKMITRTIPKNDTPLTTAVKNLLSGPQSGEKGCQTLIPEGTRLLGASVKNGIATLNFSEEFEYNMIGADGYRAQLMQVVYTATEFSTVNSVQFLVEGERKEYIGSGEDMWMWIGSPYSRASFN